MRLLRKNWKLLAGLIGLGIAREILQRRKTISLQDKVVVITGGSRGLGLATAHEFAQAGAKLAICARNEEELLRAQTQLTASGAQVLLLPYDITDQEQARTAIEQATAYFGRIDILINNAGIISAGPWQTLTRNDFAESMDTIFWGTYNMTMAVLPQMTARKQGRIVNITSIGGKVSVPHLLSYSSAKFATVGFSEGLHAELAREGVVVVTVAPGLLRTGSHINAIIKGEKHTQEYALFTLVDTLPFSSIDARRAARQILQATRRGKTALTITLQAQIIALLHGIFPGLTTEMLGLVNRLLPAGDGAGTSRYQGRESETAITRSFLTRLGQNAARAYNEQPET